MVSPDYTVRLERVFSGPMDLLLHLVREQEVEIHEIEINRVIDGFLGYLQQMEKLDLEVAGEFLVMAASLMAIKSRSLLPHEEVDLEDELDPRDELIQRLLQYRRFRESSERLGEKFFERSLIHDRGYRRELKDLEDAPMLDLGELTAWDLLGTYSRLLHETSAVRPHKVRMDERPMRFYVDKLVYRLKVEANTSLKAMVEGLEADEGRDVTIGCFCALLELVKLGVVEVDQEARGDDIGIRVRSEHQGDIESVVRSTGFDDEQPDHGEGGEFTAAEPVSPEEVVDAAALETGPEEAAESLETSAAPGGEAAASDFAPADETPASSPD